LPNAPDHDPSASPPGESPGEADAGEVRLRELLRRQEHFLRATTAVSSSLRLEEVLARLVHEAALSTDSSGADIHVVDSPNRALLIRAGCREAPPGKYQPLDLATVTPEAFDDSPLMLEVIERRQLVVTRGRHDPQLFPLERAWAERCQINATMGVPVIVGGEVLGVLVLFRHEERREPFTADDVESGRFIAGQAGIALENVRLFERVEAINLIAQVVTSALDLDTIVAAVTEQIRRLIHGAGVSLTTYLPETDEMLIQATTPEIAQLCQVIGTRVPAQGTGLLHAWRTQTPLLVRDILGGNLPSWLKAIQDWPRIAEAGVRCFLHVPVTFDDECLAILSVTQAQPNSLTPAHVELLTGVSRHLGIAVHHARRQDELRRAAEAEKMAALGQLAAGVAHNLNNALAVVLGNAQLALMQPALPAPVTHGLRRIERTALDAAATVARIQQFSRKAPPDLRRLVTLDEIAREVRELSRPLWQHECQSRGVAIDFQLELASTPPVLAHPGELCEVLLNLIRNSVQAMPGGGTLVLRTAFDPESVFLAVADTGIGMNDEACRRAFEPFFTTKADGEGTGLGLSVSYGLVAQHGGTITVASHPEEGSTFTLCLPRTSSGDAEGRYTGVRVFGRSGVQGEEGPLPDHLNTRTPERLDTGAQRQGANVLLIEDDAMNREVVAEILAHAGHHVVTAESGRDGLTRFGGEHFDAVITDQSMPGLTGMEIAARVKALQPKIPVLLLTGWGTDALRQTPACVDRVLSKPIGTDELLDALEEALGRAAPSS
jgi:signal transduction histidine kinase/ActR/RegA family two-component response regulator